MALLVFFGFCRGSLGCAGMLSFRRLEFRYFDGFGMGLSRGVRCSFGDGLCSTTS